MSAVIVLDMAGTTVADDGAVEAAFLKAMAAVGGPEPRLAAMVQYVRATMGRSKIDVFTELLDGDIELAGRANQAFETAYADGLDRVHPIPGAEKAIDTLRADGGRIALTTGFSAPTQAAIVEALGWTDRVDLLLAPGLGVRGRPHPDLPLTAFLRLQGQDVKDLVVVGDTTSDVLSGVRAGAGRAIGVLTGAHREDDLWASGATHVLASVADLPGLLGCRH